MEKKNQLQCFIIKSEEQSKREGINWNSPNLEVVLIYQYPLNGELDAFTEEALDQLQSESSVTNKRCSEVKIGLVIKVNFFLQGIFINKKSEFCKAFEFKIFWKKLEFKIKK